MIPIEKTGQIRKKVGERIGPGWVIMEDSMEAGNDSI
jgi:hypothetical protein